MSVLDQLPEGFKVGGHYENRKGVFEVISIKGCDMEIRWDHTGETVVTPIAFQLSVLRKMAKETMAAQADRRKGATQKQPSWLGQGFHGLIDSDFSEDVTGTHWRSREQLGGAITKLLQIREPWNSWSIYRRAQVHWAAVERYTKLAALYQAKYLVQLGPEGLICGLYVERSSSPSEHQEDWRAFVHWLSDPDHAKWFHQTIWAHRATILDPYAQEKQKPFSISLTPSEEGYVYVHDSEPPRAVSPEGLGVLLGDVPNHYWIDLLLCVTINRAEALAAGARVAERIANYFNALLPAYWGSQPQTAIR